MALRGGVFEVPMKKGRETKGSAVVHTVDASEILQTHQLRLVVFVPIIYTVVKVDGATPKRWRFVRGHDKPIHGSC